MTRPTLHPIDNRIYTGLLLLISSNDGITQTELHNELNHEKNKKSIVSTLQKIKKLETSNLIFKDEKGTLRNAKKVYLNFNELIKIISSYYLFKIQMDIYKEINQEFKYWKSIQKNYVESQNENSDDYPKILHISNTIASNYEYIIKNLYSEEDLFNGLYNAWFVNLLRYVLYFHARNHQYYEIPFSHLLFSIIDYFIINYEEIEEYISSSTNEKLLSLPILNLKNEKEINDYVEGKNDTLELFDHIRKIRLIRPLFSHSTNALWILEGQTII
ncbi:MAG: hypothetical protein O8C64_08700 [Candidatus Methanoperedens sp.]|nr:hypothetical protein [Candidatus Methanoperedens sp.]